MSTTYWTPKGIIQIEKIKGMEYFSKFIKDGSSMLLDNRMIDLMIRYKYLIKVELQL